MLVPSDPEEVTVWWLVATPVLVVLVALVRWGRARRPGLRERSLPTEIGKIQGDVGMYGGGFRGDHGPTPGSGGL